MRIALTSLILTAGLVSAAAAQEAAQPAASAPAPAAAAAAAPAAQPAAPAAAPAQDAGPPPALPTTGDGAAVLKALDGVCVAAVHGQGVDAAAKAAGAKMNRRDGSWVLPLGGASRDYTINFQPQGSQKDVCAAEIHFAVGADKDIVSALNIWSYLHKPELVLQANYVNVDADGVKRTRKSWEHAEPTGAVTAVNFSLMRKPDDSPLNAKYDTGMLFYQERAN